MKERFITAAVFLTGRGPVPFRDPVRAVCQRCCWGTGRPDTRRGHRPRWLHRWHVLERRQGWLRVGPELIEGDL